MKKNLFYAFAMAALTLGALGSCTSTDPIDDNGGGKAVEEGDAYASVSITIPSTNASTRGEAEGDGIATQEGTPEEYEVKTLYLYFFDKASSDANAATSRCRQSITIPASNFIAVDVNPTSKNVVYTSVATKLKTGTYRVYATVNTAISSITTDPEGVTGTDEETLRRRVVENAPELTGVPASGMPMASRTKGVNGSSPFVEMTITTNNNINNPAPVAFEVERMVARVDVAYNASTETDGTYILFKADGTTEYARVKVEGFTIVNKYNKYHNFRQVGAFPEGTHDILPKDVTFGDLPNSNATTDYYVLSPGTSSMKDITAETKDMLGQGKFFNALNYAPYTYTNVPAKNAANAVSYTYENCLFKDQQIQGYSTGIIYKATVTPKNLTYWDGTALVSTTDAGTIAANKGANFYYINNNFYPTVDVLIRAGFTLKTGTGSDLTDAMVTNALNNPTTANPSPAQIEKIFADKNIKHLKDGKCYYEYWMQHAGGLGVAHAASKMHPMEFGVVRNNLYRVTVEGVKAIGFDDETDPPIEEYDKDNDVYLTVVMTVKPWILRANTIVL